MNWVFICGGLLLCLALFAEAQTGLLQEKSLDSVQEILRNVESVQMPTVHQSGCSCVDNNCGCCLDLDVPEIKLKDLMCLNITYLPDEYGFRLTVTINKLTLVNVTVSVKNPPPICFGIPYLEKEASFCIDFYNLDVKNKTFSGCVKLEITLLHVLIFDENFGCFHIPLRGRNSVEHAQLMVESFKAKAAYRGKF